MITTSSSSQIVPYIRALRPRQWTKNLIVFAAPLFAFGINIETGTGSLLAFVLFCCASSSFYLLNDIVDVEADRQHPVKCKRPIAAGLVSIPVALGMAAILMSTALIVGWLRARGLGAAITSYALLQTAYNLKLKRIVILDITAISVGFILRAYAGASASQVILSTWFLLCTGMLALFLAIEKRKAELRLLQIKGGKTRSVLKYYSLSLLARMENIVTTGAIITYTIWSSGPQVQGAKTPWMLITVPFVLYGIFRYQLLSEPQAITQKENEPDHKSAEKSERPEEVLLKDLPILLTVIGWVFTTFVILFLKSQGYIQ